MAASDLAFLKARDKSEDRVTAEAGRKRAEGRQDKADERSDVLFDRSKTLFEQQQEFIKDERRLTKLSRDGNSAVALFRATKGQVFQPILDVYSQIPDGGKFHLFRRNEDGTFDYDIEWAGQRHKMEGASFDEVGKMVMSIANPVLYLEQSGAIAAAEAEHTKKLELARIRARKSAKSDVKARLFNGRLSTTEYLKMREGYFKEYTDFRNNDPDLLRPPDATEEDGFRQMTFEEYATARFAELGIDVTGAEIKEDGSGVDISGPKPNPTTATFGEMRRFFSNTGEENIDDSIFGSTGRRDSSVDEAIVAFLDANRSDDLVDLFLSDKSIKNTLTPEQESLILSAASRKASGQDPLDPKAAAEEEKRALIIVERDEEAKKDKNPLKAYAERHRKQKSPVSLADIARGLKSIGRWIAEVDDNARRRRIKTLWTAFESGNESHPNVIKMLQAGQSPEGLEKLASEYRKIRIQLPTELQEKLDKVFTQPSKSGAIADTSAG